MTVVVLVLAMAIVGGCSSATTIATPSSGTSLGVGDPVGVATVRYEGYFERQQMDYNR